jgi:hypothetical protein
MLYFSGALKPVGVAEVLGWREKFQLGHTRSPKREQAQQSEQNKLGKNLIKLGF